MKAPRRYVVDTNVLVVANGRHKTVVGLACKLKCIEFLERVLDEREHIKIAVDAGGEIQIEYRTYCNPSGQPSVGDRFFLALLQNYDTKVTRISLAKNELGNYVDFPADIRLKDFDRADRKFAAVARRARALVVNAADARSWPLYKDVLLEYGIAVVQLC